MSYLGIMFKFLGIALKFFGKIFKFTVSLMIFLVVIKISIPFLQLVADIFVFFYSNKYLIGIGFIIFIAFKIYMYRQRRIAKDLYFQSEEFLAIKSEVDSLVVEHNAVAEYVTEIYSKGLFDLGASTTGRYAHLASVRKVEYQNYKGAQHEPTYHPNVHNASLQVVSNAERDPIHYLMKYFHIYPDLETLKEVQQISMDIDRLESAIENLNQREEYILDRGSPPDFIVKYYKKEFWGQVNVCLMPIVVPYSTYKFEYVSAAGNKKRTVTITLDIPTLEALSETIAREIRRRESAAGQRALMTTKLRELIKERDEYTCQNPSCGLSIMEEPNLLLEVDHIIPISRGGLSEPDNLQTLCWRCNRAKGSKMITQ